MALIKHVYHSDHGVTGDVLKSILAGLEAEGKLNGFFLQTVTLPEGVSLRNALYGPRSGDEAVAEADVYYAKRSEDRPESRLVRRPLRPTNLATIIGVGDSDGVTVYTVYGGPAAEREPGDKSLATDADREAARQFWAVHALAGGAPTSEA